MIVPLLLALLQSPAGPGARATPPGGDYASEALRRLVAEAATANRRVPPALRAYRAHMESELALLVQRPEGEEGAVSVEQVASEVRWWRGGELEQRVVGYRAQTAAPVPSALTFLRQSWAVPVLYGNRVVLFFGLDSAAEARRGARRRRRRDDGVVAVHPLAEDRDSVYRYSGGDTVVTLRSGGRAIPLVRVRVEPARALRARTLAFSGELELDAVRRQLVRMRGRFLVVGGRRGIGARLRDGALIQSAAYVELVNAEVERDYWLPAYQRIEGVAAVPVLGAGRSAFRVVSRFRGYALTVGPDSMPDERGAAGDTMIARPHGLSFAGRDSVDRYGGWERALGGETAATRSGDFADLAPDAWRARRDPWVALRAQRLSELFHYNRVEGAYTGVALTAGLGAREPGLTLRGATGWAWAEQTTRGQLGAELRRGRWAYGAGWGRALDMTNDFVSPFDSTAALAALLGSQDEYDYVDRHFALLSATRLFTSGSAPGGRRAVLRAEGGIVSDRAEERRTRRGLLPVSGGFRENRGVTPGRYGRATLTLDFDPDVTAEFVRPGVGGRLRYTVGAGDLDFRRAEGRLVARATRGPVTYAARLEGGVVTSDAPPPQQLFELGGTQRLSGYDYKEFAGDQAASAGVIVMRALPFWRSPLRVRRFFYFPAPAPALAVALESGWVEASNDAARNAVRLLGERVDPATGAAVPISRPTDGVRTSVELGVRFFGGSIGVGIARPVDRGARWRGVVVLGQEP